MEELKTLKDFERIKGQFTTEDICKAKNYPKGIIIDALGCPHIDIRILRAEAIKWIKALKKDYNNADKNNRIFYISNDSDIIINDMLILWIQRFFNITDSELSKEG